MIDGVTAPFFWTVVGIFYLGGKAGLTPLDLIFGKHRKDRDD